MDIYSVKNFMRRLPSSLTLAGILCSSFFAQFALGQTSLPCPALLTEPLAIHTALRQVSRSHVAPLIMGATDQVLRRGAQTQNPLIVFIARDGLAGYSTARVLLQRFPERYGRLTAANLRLLPLNRYLLSSPLLRTYLIQQGITQNVDVTYSDLGWYGSALARLRSATEGAGARFAGLHVVLANSESSQPELHGFLTVRTRQAPIFERISGNPTVHFLEDTFSGVSGQSRELVQYENGEIVPMVAAEYGGEIAMRRNIAIAALIESATEVTSQQLTTLSDPAQIADHVRRTQELERYIGSLADPYSQLGVPHERH